MVCEHEKLLDDFRLDLFFRNVFQGFATFSSNSKVLQKCTEL